jgi:nitrite reductase/ring-hydroxylating ferredoxin subunit
MGHLIRVPGAASLKHGETRVFSWDSPHGELQGFVIRHGDVLRAYENKCRHWPIPLDYGDAEFWYADIDRITCKTHGATYDPATGECDSGPCTGAFLTRFDLEVKGDDVVVKVP